MRDFILPDTFETLKKDESLNSNLEVSKGDIDFPKKGVKRVINLIELRSELSQAGFSSSMR